METGTDLSHFVVYYAREGEEECVMGFFTLEARALAVCDLLGPTSRYSRLSGAMPTNAELAAEDLQTTLRVVPASLTEESGLYVAI